MGLISKFRSYLLEDNFSINIVKNKVDVINYSSIGIIDSNKITIYYDEGELVISGKNLSLVKMIDNEVLISGSISGIELR